MYHRPAPVFQNRWALYLYSPGLYVIKIWEDVAGRSSRGHCRRASSYLVADGRLVVAGRRSWADHSSRRAIRKASSSPHVVADHRAVGDRKSFFPRLLSVADDQTVAGVLQKTVFHDEVADHQTRVARRAADDHHLRVGDDQTFVDDLHKTVFPLEVDGLRMRVAGGQTFVDDLDKTVFPFAVAGLRMPVCRVEADGHRMRVADDRHLLELDGPLGERDQKSFGLLHAVGDPHKTVFPFEVADLRTLVCHVGVDGHQMRVADDRLVERDQKIFGLPNALAVLRMLGGHAVAADLRMVDAPAVAARLARQNRLPQIPVCQTLYAEHFAVRVEDNGRLFHRGRCADG